MAEATYYDPATGKITGTITCSESAFWSNVEDADWVAGTFNADKYYIDPGTVHPVPRPEMEGVTVAGNIVSGLPAPCEVECNGAEYKITDGEFEYDTPVPGTYPIKIKAWPYIEWEGEITVENNTSTE